MVLKLSYMQIVELTGCFPTDFAERHFVDILYK